MLTFSGFGQLPVRFASGGGGSTGIPKSDYIKQLQCLLNISMQMPEAIEGFQSSKTFWDRAVAMIELPIDGVLKKGSRYGGDPSWDNRTEADVMMLLGNVGISQFSQFWSSGAITPTLIEADVTRYVTAAKQFVTSSRAAGDWGPNIAACDFPAQTAARLAAEAAAALQAAANQAAAEAEAAARAAEQAAAEQREADAAEAMKAAERAAAEAIHLQEQADLEAERAAQLLQQQAAAQPDEGRESPGMTVDTMPVPAVPSLPGVTLPAWTVADERKRMIKLGMIGGGLALGVGLLAFTVSRSRR